uniref:Leucine rich adaptor protein 1-like n=1 Tax=Geotrypetes seraphini TaxID=260995 RepID=A0A6P8NFU6_GEOSA|nr:leucine rich adaptor protein 1-like [Geotrypetes seraphini]
MEDSSLLDLRDIEIKLGRKVPESLLKSLREEARDDHPTFTQTPATLQSSSALDRLETRIHLLKQEMVHLRATDVKLMRQLLIINESIESIKWMIEEKSIVTSRGSSISGSLCSLLESQDTSLHGSYNSLQDCSDGMDGISVGSYLDTLADDVPGHCTPSDLDQFDDTRHIGDSIGSQSFHKHSKNDSDEYYCFG